MSLPHKITCLSFTLLMLIQTAYAQTQLVRDLKAGRDQTVVVYGTSLSSGGHGHAWMDEVARQLNERYGDHLDYYLAGKGGMWSTWGVQHLEDSVIKKEPDVVIIEFAINDAFYKYNTPVELARLNLEYMIERIQLFDASCEIILQIMNMPIGKSARYRPELDEYYNMYRKVAQERGVLLIDHYANWQKILDQGEDVFLDYVPDGIHPSEKSGRTIIAPFFLKKLASKI